MGERLSLKDFDILGTIRLNEINGIEKYVTPIIEDGKDKTYISRSKEYYNVKSMYELALERQYLEQLLTREHSKRNFVIIENMLNCSAKVYFKKFQQYIVSGKSLISKNEMERARECLMEDVRNLLVILENEGIISVDPSKTLPVGRENCEKRAIEMDNKAILYIFSKSLDGVIARNPKDVEVLTPGYGSMYIGPFLNAMYGYNYTNMFKSKYIEENRTIETNSMSALMSSDRVFEEGKTVFALDDNIGTGATMKELKEELHSRGVDDIVSGAIQYNWRNYYRVSIGDKTDIDRFEVDDFDIVSPLNYAGHKLYKHAISLLLSSGAEYDEYLKSKSYLKPDCNDIKGAMIRGASCAAATGLTISEKIDPRCIVQKTYDSENLLDRYKNGTTEITNPTSKRVVDNIIENIESLDRPTHPQVGEIR